MKPQVFLFIGRAGSGKGTQAKLLVKALERKDPIHEVLYIETGAEFRKFILEDNYTAKICKGGVEQGLLMPEFMSIYLWAKVMVMKYKGDQHIVFDGTPRKLLEAVDMQSLYPFYGFEKPSVIYLNIESGESMQRLEIRQEGRADDSRESIKRRQEVFEKEIVPVIDYYRIQSEINFIEVDGTGLIEEVHDRVVKTLGL